MDERVGTFILVRGRIIIGKILRILSLLPSCLPHIKGV